MQCVFYIVVKYEYLPMYHILSLVIERLSFTIGDRERDHEFRLQEFYFKLLFRWIKSFFDSTTTKNVSIKMGFVCSVESNFGDYQQPFVYRHVLTHECKLEKKFEFDPFSHEISELVCVCGRAREKNRLF